MRIPSELELMSVFECEPILLEKQKDYPFYYNQATYKFHNQHEKFEIVLCPSYKEFILTVWEKDTNRLISHIKLLAVQKLEIIDDKKAHSQILLTAERGKDDIIQTWQIQLKPRFSIVFKEHFLR